MSARSQLMATDLTKLPIEQRLELVQDLWESIAAESSSVPVDPKHLAEVRERLARYRIDGAQGEPARDVAERIRREL
jgi:putative addiction module component (TIGR02574 family)